MAGRDGGDHAIAAYPCQALYGSRPAVAVDLCCSSLGDTLATVGALVLYWEELYLTGLGQDLGNAIHRAVGQVFGPTKALSDVQGCRSRAIGSHNEH